MTVSPTTAVARWKAVALGLLFALAGLVIWNGADRKASDATQPLSQSPAPKALRSAPQTLKLGSFNIHSGKGRDGVLNLSRTAELLSDIDFVGLYEVRATSQTNQPNQAASLASLCEAAWLFAPTEQQWWTNHFGNGLLFRRPLRSVMRIPLVNTRGKAYRNSILSTVELEHADVQIISVHIDRENDRRSQLQSMIDLFLGLQAPCVLMGDLNTTEGDPLLIGLRDRQGVHSPLHESLEQGPPSGTIDWIFTRGLKTISAALIDNGASDHPFVKVELAPLDLPEDDRQQR